MPDSAAVVKRSKGEQTKAAIIDAALALFTERGFDATTMRAIAESAGVSLGNAYYYFRSKDELVQGFYDRTAVEHGERLPEVLDGLDGLADRLTAHLDLWFELMAPQHPFAVGFFRNAADPASPLSPFSAASAPARTAAIELMELVVEGTSPAVPATVRAQLPEVLWLYHMGVVLFWVHDRSVEQAATRLLVRRTAPMIERVVALADLPALQATIVDLTTLLADLKAMAG